MCYGELTNIASPMRRICQTLRCPLQGERGAHAEVSLSAAIEFCPHIVLQRAHSSIAGGKRTEVSAEANVIVLAGKA